VLSVAAGLTHNTLKGATVAISRNAYIVPYNAEEALNKTAIVSNCTEITFGFDAAAKITKMQHPSALQCALQR
jgi:hypothetical protein